MCCYGVVLALAFDESDMHAHLIPIGVALLHSHRAYSSLQTDSLIKTLIAGSPSLCLCVGVDTYLPALSVYAPDRHDDVASSTSSLWIHRFGLEYCLSNYNCGGFGI